MSKDIVGHLGALHSRAGPDLEILTSHDGETFVEHGKRWTDIGRQTPAAIVLPVSEEQIHHTVQWAAEHSIPFVTKSGGHSEWSTVDSSGIIIDLSKYKGITVEGSMVSLRGSVTLKDVAVALAEVSLFTALGNGNPVGAIPYFLNGGASVVNSRIGFGSDQIVSARMVDAKGQMIKVDENSNPDLLWALRGAGQFFGLVTELTVRAYPFSVLGNDKGSIWSGLFVFPLEKATEVIEAMSKIANDQDFQTGGLFMVMAPPPKRQPSLVVAARYYLEGDETRDNAGIKAAYKPLYDLQPLVANGGPVPIQNFSDGRDAFNAKGDFKRFATVGLGRFDTSAFLQVVDLWNKMVHECPDAIATSFNFQWDSRLAAPVEHAPTCSSLHDVRFWQNNFIWHTDVQSRDRVDSFSNQAVQAMRGAERIDFQNATRSEPIEYRFRDSAKLKKLRDLKKTWDPEGMFTRQLLD